MRYNVLQLLTYASLAASALVMPLFAAELGADPATIGLIGAGYGLASFFSNTLLGRAGDRFDRRALLLGGFLASAVAAALQLVSDSPASFLLSRCLYGFTVGMIPPTLAAYVYDIRRPLGKFTSYNAAGWLVASLLVVGVGFLATNPIPDSPLNSAQSLIVDKVGPSQTLFLLSAGFCLVAFFLTLRLAPMRLGLPVSLFPRAVLARNLHVYLSVFIRHFGAAGIWIIYPLYIIQLGGDFALVGWVHLVNMVSQIFVYRNVERFARLGSARVLIGVGLVLSALTFFSFALVRNAYQLLPLQIPLGISFASLWLGSMKEVMEHNTERATATGLLNASMNLSNVAGPFAGGLIALRYGFRPTMYFAAAVTLVAFALFWLLRPRMEPAHVVLPSPREGPASDVAP